MSAQSASGPAPLLELSGLVTELHTPRGRLRPVDGVDLRVLPGEAVGVVGESGCGKSVTALSVMRLLPEGVGEIVSGQVRFRGKDLVSASERELQQLRGNGVSMVFQEPLTSLNPLYTVGAQVAEPLRVHRGMGKAEARARAVSLLREVGIPSPEERASAYPHQLSGGMRQRVMIAMALACDPELLIADEPTTALDVTIQAELLALLDRLRRERGMGLLLITHDLGVVAQTCDRVLVMYAGRVVEEAPTAQLFERPRHPYTQGLLGSLPKGDRARLQAIPGAVPSLSALPRGCRFQDRCPRRIPRCVEEDPKPADLNPSRRAACFNPVPAPEEAPAG